MEYDEIDDYFKTGRLEFEKKKRELFKQQAGGEDLDTLDYIQDVGGAIVYGAGKAIDESIETVVDVVDYAAEGVASFVTGRDIEFGDGVYEVNRFRNLGDEGDTAIGKAAEEISRFMTGYFVPAGMVLKGGKAAMGLTNPTKRLAETLSKTPTSKLGKIGKTVGYEGTRSGLASAMTRDGFEEKLSDVIGEDVPIFGMLASQPDDTVFEDKLKALGEDFIIGGAFGGLLTSLGYAWKGMKPTYNRLFGERVEGKSVLTKDSKGKTKVTRTDGDKAADKITKVKTAVQNAKIKEKKLNTQAEKISKKKEAGKKVTTEEQDILELQLIKNITKKQMEEGLTKKSILMTSPKPVLQKLVRELGVSPKGKKNKAQLADALVKKLNQLEKKYTTKPVKEVKVNPSKTGIQKPKQTQLVDSKFAKEFVDNIAAGKTMEQIVKESTKTLNFTKSTYMKDKKTYFSKFNPDDNDELLQTVSEGVNLLTPMLKQIKGTKSVQDHFDDAARFHSEITGQSVDEVKAMVNSAFAMGKGIEEATAALLTIDSKIMSQTKIVSDLAKMAQKNTQTIGDSVAFNVERELIENLEILKNLMSASKMIKTPMGRGLRLVREDVKRMDDILATMDDVKKASFGGEANYKMVINSLAKMDDLNNAKQLLKNLDNPSFFTKGAGLAAETFRSMILLNMKTHITNTLSGAVETNVVPLERMIGSYLGRTVGLIDEKAATEMLKETKVLYAGLKFAYNDSLAMAKTAFKQEQNILDPLAKVADLADYNRISAGAMGIRKDTKMGGLFDNLGKGVRISLRTLGAEDEFIKQMNYRTFLFQKAYTKALDSGLKETDEAFEKFIQTQVSKGFDKFGKGIDEEALQYARKITFTEDLENSFFKGIQNFAKSHPAVQMLLPFVRTPSNLILRAIERSGPVALLSKKFRDKLLRGTPDEKATMLGRLALSSTIVGSAVFAALDGKITGAGPADVDQNRLWQMAGNKPYHIKVGDVEFGYNRLDPIFMPIGAIANAIEAGNYTAGAGEIENIILAVSTTISDKAYFQGMATFLGAIVEANPSSGGKLQRFLENMATSFIPAFPQQVAEIFTKGGKAILMSNQFVNSAKEGEQYQYPELKEAIGYSDKAIRRLPFVNDELPTKWNWLTGDPVQNYDSMSFGIPIRSKKSDKFAAQEEVLNELVSLNYGFAGVDKKLMKIDLTTEEFSDFNYFMGNVELKVGGKNRTLLEALKYTINSKAYNKDNPSKAFDKLFPSPEIKIISKVFSKYRLAARAELLKKYPELREKFEAGWIARATGDNSAFEALLESNR